MRILHVVTYVSPDGAYGGPTRVALNQSKSLRDLGHEVVVAAAAGGFGGKLPETFDGFPVKLFPSQRILSSGGFASLISPGLFVWLTKAIRGADIIHVHLARDLITLPAAALGLLAGKPMVVQTHGMVDKPTNRLAIPLDQILTIPILRKASKVLFLTEHERNDIIEVAGNGCRLRQLANGIRTNVDLSTEQVSGPSTQPEVLFLARLHARKRPVMFVKAASTLAHRWPNVRWRLVGPNEGEGDQVNDFIGQEDLEDSVEWEGALSPEKTLARMRSASIYVLPATNEPFGMSVIEAMSIGIPVVVTQSCGLANFVEANYAGLVCDESQKDLNRAIETLIADPGLRITMGRNARIAVEAFYSMDIVASKLIKEYDDSCSIVGRGA